MTAAQQRLGGPRAVIEQVLAVVQHDQRLRLLEVGDRGLRARTARGAACTPSGLGDRLGRAASPSASGASSTHQTPSGKRSSVSAAACAASRVLPHPPAPVSVRSRVSPSDPGELLRARARVRRSSSAGREGCSATRSSDRSGSRVARQVRVGEREHVLRPPEVAKTMGAEVDERGALRQPLDDEVVDRAREQRLPAVRDPPQPRAATQGDAEVVALVAQLCLGGVQRDPDAPARCPPARRAARAPAGPRAPPHRVRGAGRRRPRRCRPRPARPGARRRDGRSPRRAARSASAPPAAIASGCASHSRVDPSMSVSRNVTVPAGNASVVSTASSKPAPQSVGRASARPCGNPDTLSAACRPVAPRWRGDWSRPRSRGDRDGGARRHGCAQH